MTAIADAGQKPYAVSKSWVVASSSVPLSSSPALSELLASASDAAAESDAGVPSLAGSGSDAGVLPLAGSTVVLEGAELGGPSPDSGAASWSTDEDDEGGGPMKTGVLSGGDEADPDPDSELEGAPLACAAFSARSPVRIVSRPGAGEERRLLDRYPRFCSR
jgi:hypothetical protein